jgi:hypothetical protein
MRATAPAEENALEGGYQSKLRVAIAKMNSAMPTTHNTMPVKRKGFDIKLSSYGWRQIAASS